MSENVEVAKKNASQTGRQKTEARTTARLSSTAKVTGNAGQIGKVQNSIKADDPRKSACRMSSHSPVPALFRSAPGSCAYELRQHG